jgi:hypothetical protein
VSRIVLPGLLLEEGQSNGRGTGQIFEALLEGGTHWPPWLLTSSLTRSGSVCTLTPRIIAPFLKSPPAEVIGGRRRRLLLRCRRQIRILPNPRSPLLCALSLFIFSNKSGEERIHSVLSGFKSHFLPSRILSGSRAWKFSGRFDS